jgi:predicted GNAT family N-acyltransferase
VGLSIQQVRFTDAEFARCFAIRLAVFVQEQNVPAEEERDEYDETALHYLATENGAALGTARVLLKHQGVKITRVAVVKSARGRGIGAALMRHIEDTVPAAEYLLDAQSHALGFYAALGYFAYGEAFMEAGIAHFHMRKPAMRPDVSRETLF